MTARRRHATPRGQTSGDEPASLLKRRPRIDEVLARQEMRDLMQKVKHHFAIAAGIDHFGDPVRHQAAALPASIAIWRMVDAVRAEPGNASLPERPIYNYIANLAFAGLTAPIASEDDRRQVYLPVFLPRGRPPTRRSRFRQRLIEEIRARPDMPDYRIKDRARFLGVWSDDQADDPANVRRRIARLRRDAAS